MSENTTDILILGMAWLLTSFAFLYIINRFEHARSRERAEMWEERAAWSRVQADLLSRIQAGSYGEYKAMEIKSVKAQVEAVPNHIEQL